MQQLHDLVMCAMVVTNEISVRLWRGNTAREKRMRLRYSGAAGSRVAISWCAGLLCVGRRSGFETFVCASTPATNSVRDANLLLEISVEDVNERDGASLHHLNAPRAHEPRYSYTNGPRGTAFRVRNTQAKIQSIL
jgi:hypothetical protein